MKSIFDTVSKDCSKIVTKTYSTSFSMATKMLASSIRQDIYNIYGFVRLADEIVDIVDTGNTLKANGLEARESISEVSCGGDAIKTFLQFCDKTTDIVKAAKGSE